MSRPTDLPRGRAAPARGARLLLALAVLAVVLLPGTVSPAVACGCGAFVDPVEGRTDAAVLEETAVLSLREGRESIVMGLSLDGARTGSALLMPTPSVPEVSLGHASTLREMQSATAPREEVTTTIWGRNPLLAGAPGDGAPAGAGPDVTVHQQSRIGDYEVAVLGGEAEGVRSWLDENDYALGDEVSALIDPYTEDGWTLTAVRFAEDAELSGELDPLRFDFATDTLVYPIRFSQAAEQYQEVHLFVLAGGPVRRTDSSASTQGVARPWIADPTAEGWTWSDDTLRELVDETGAGTGPGDGARHGMVTEFLIGGDPESLTTDMTFAADPDAEEIVPTYSTTVVVTWWGVPVGWWIVVVGLIAVVCLLALAGVVVRTRSERRELRRREVEVRRP